MSECESRAVVRAFRVPASTVVGATLSLHNGTMVMTDGEAMDEENRPTRRSAATPGADVVETPVESPHPDDAAAPFLDRGRTVARRVFDQINREHGKSTKRRW